MYRPYIIHIRNDGYWRSHHLFTLKSVSSILAKYPDWQEYMIFDANTDCVQHKVQLMGQEVNWL